MVWGARLNYIMNKLHALIRGISIDAYDTDKIKYHLDLGEGCNKLVQGTTDHEPFEVFGKSKSNTSKCGVEVLNLPYHIHSSASHYGFPLKSAQFETASEYVLPPMISPCRGMVCLRQTSGCCVYHLQS